MSDSSLVVFTIGVSLLLALPGPTNALLAASGAGHGWRGALMLIAAELAGYTLALTTLLSLEELAGSVRGEIGLLLRAAAAALMLVTAWRMWRGTTTASGSDAMAAGAPGAGNVFLLTLFNPKGLILGFAIFPPVMAEAGLAIPASLFAAIVVLTGLGWIGVGAAARRLPGRPSVAVARLSSLVIGGFACYFAFTVAMELMAPAAA